MSTTTTTESSPVTISADDLMASAQDRIAQGPTARRIAPEKLDAALIAAESMQWVDEPAT